MAPMETTLPWMAMVIVTPLGTATLSILAGHRLVQTVLFLTVSGVGLSLTGLTWQLWHYGPLHYAIGAWGAPLGIRLYADGLSVLMLWMTGVVAACTSLYAHSYIVHDPEPSETKQLFWPLWLFMWAALNALFLSSDIFNLYVTLELLTLAGAPLVALGGGAALVAAMRYLLFAILASLAYLLGVALLYGAFGTLDITMLGRESSPNPLTLGAMVLLTVALLLKSAVFPLHFWLPPAHAAAPSPVSAMLSALVVKASFYLLARLWFVVFPAALTSAAAQGMGILAALAVFWGSVQALRTDRLKLLIAYSTVAQIGYLYLLFPLATIAASGATDALQDAWNGTAYQALSHALAKASLFLSVGAVLYSLGHDRLDGIDGMAQHFPLTLFSIGVAGMSLMGLPPSGGFVAKWLLIQSALALGLWQWVVVIIGGGLLAAAYLFRILRHAFVNRQSDEPWKPVPRVMEHSALALAMLALLLGFAATPALALLKVGAPF